MNTCFIFSLQKISVWRTFAGKRSMGHDHLRNFFITKTCAKYSSSYYYSYYLNFFGTILIHFFSHMNLIVKSFMPLDMAGTWMWEGYPLTSFFSFFFFFSLLIHSESLQRIILSLHAALALMRFQKM